MGRCRNCGKSLSDPVSQSAGVGPVCALRHKAQEAQHNNQADLFGPAVFTYSVVGDVVVIYDSCNGGKTVTNDVDCVLETITAELGCLAGKRVIYRDTDGIFDGIRINEAGRFAGFIGIRTDNEDAAVGNSWQAA